MAKSAKDKVAAKLAVDGTPRLAAKSKPSDKHEKPNLNIEEATVASPRPSRKRAGDYFDFDPDTVADDDAGVGAKSSTKAGASKAEKPSKKAKTGAEPIAKKGGKKSKASSDAAIGVDDGETLEDRVVAEDAKKSKGKKADSAKKNVVVGPSGDTAAVAADKETGAMKGKAKKAEGATADTVGDKKGKAKKADTADAEEGKNKKADTSKDATAGTKKAKGKKTSAVKKDAGNADDDETIEDRVVAPDVKNSKAKKAKTAKHDVVVSPSADTAEVPVEPKAKKGKAAKESAAAAKDKADGAKASEKDGKKSAAKAKPESSKASKKADKGSIADPSSTKPKETAKKAAPKEETSKGKDAKGSANTEPKGTAKKSKAKASKDTPAAAADTALDQGPFENLLNSTDKGTTPVPQDGKASKAPTPKKDTKKPSKEAAADKSGKKAKDGEAAKPKKAGKAKDNKPDIPDQAVQPMDLVEEEAAINALSKPAASAPKGKKRKAISDTATETVKSDILDPLSEHAADESAKKKQKKSRKSLGESLGEVLATGADAVRHSLGGLLGGGTDGKPTTTGSSKKSKGKGKATDTAQPPANEAPQDVAEEDEDEEEEEEADDQTTALLAGFESEGDDVHPPGDAGFTEGANIPELPNSKATAKKLKAIKPAEKETPGVVYVGRIPHGFYEHEMRTYFTQFGDVNRLRLSRARKTGHSKHYAFLEFKNEDVAKIVAQTMDNYLMFGHILKCKIVPAGNVHENIWKGAGKRFKKVPWNILEGRKLEVPVGREVWKQREEKETAKRAAKGKKMLETVGYAFEGTGLKSVDSIPKKIKEATGLEENEKSLVTAGGEEASGPVVVSEEVTTIKVKEAGKVVAEQASTSVSTTVKRALEGGEEAVASVTKKAKKTKKTAAA